MTGPAGQELPVPPWIVVALFALFFPVLWVAVLRIIASMGWSQVAAAYPAMSDPPPSARRVRWGSMRIGRGVMAANYGSTITGWLSDSGLWLRPSLSFRPFHPMIYIPWARAQSIEEERVFLFKRVRVTLAGDVPELRFTGRLGRAVLEHRREGRGTGR